MCRIFRHFLDLPDLLQSCDMKKQSMALFYISLTGNNTGEEEKNPVKAVLKARRQTAWGLEPVHFESTTANNTTASS